MQKIYILVLSIFLANVYGVQANTPIDSIGVENSKGKKVVLHQVEAKETYYSISKRYNVSYKVVMTYNDSKLLQIGLVIKVPTELPFSGSSPIKTSTKTDDIEYTVKAKDNLNLIAEQHGTTVDELKRINGLSSTNLSIGQILKVSTNGNTKNQSSSTVPPVIASKASIPNTSTTKTTEHTIRPKENLNVLAELYGTTIAEIKRLNNLNSNALQIGQVLKVPVNGNTASEVDTNVPVDNTVKNVPAVTTTSTIDHTIKAKENLNVLAERYSTTVEEIKRLNGLKSNNLQIGQVLKVPAGENSTITTVNSAAILTQKPGVETPKVAAVTKTVETSKPTATVVNPGAEHVVVAGETIYSIAKKYGLTTFQIKALNNLAGNEVTVGQKLSIKGATITQEEEENGSPNTLKDPSLRYAASRYGLTQIEEKGTAVWIADPDLDPAKMLILHRTAPVGTIIKITNPMSNRSTFAKVVGKFTENESTKDVIIVMTKAVADAVGALDKRFFCNITYGAQENEQ